MIDLATPHTLTDQERAELDTLDDATKSSLYGYVVEMLDYLGEIVGAAKLKTTDRPVGLRTKIESGPVRLLD